MPYKRRSYPALALASSSPSGGLKASARTSRPLSRRPRSARVTGSSRRTVPARPASASVVPLGLNANTARFDASSGLRRWGASGAQSTRTSRKPAASVWPSALYARARGCGLNRESRAGVGSRACSCRLAVSQTCTTPLPSEVAKVRPSRRIANASVSWMAPRRLRVARFQIVATEVSRLCVMRVSPSSLSASWLTSIFRVGRRPRWVDVRASQISTPAPLSAVTTVFPSEL